MKLAITTLSCAALLAAFFLRPRKKKPSVDLGSITVSVNTPELHAFCEQACRNIQRVIADIESIKSGDWVNGSVSV